MISMFLNRPKTMIDYFHEINQNFKHLVTILDWLKDMNYDISTLVDYGTMG